MPQEKQVSALDLRAAEIRASVADACSPLQVLAELCAEVEVQGVELANRCMSLETENTRLKAAVRRMVEEMAPCCCFNFMVEGHTENCAFGDLAKLV